MVIYFSGTGNSKFVAKRIADGIGEETADVADYLKKKEDGLFRGDKVYVFVAPSYSSAPAKALTDFIAASSFEKGAKAYFVITCVSSMGATPAIGKRLCDKKGLEYMGSIIVPMPQNYIALFTMKEEDENREIVKAALPKIDDIIKHIKNGEKLEEKKVSSVELFFTTLVAGLYYKCFMKTKKFSVSDECAGCGTCADACPYSNIKMVDGKPVWGKNCTHCMACINFCPRNGIEYGKGSVGKPRYKGPDKLV